MIDGCRRRREGGVKGEKEILSKSGVMEGDCTVLRGTLVGWLTKGKR